MNANKTVKQFSWGKAVVFLILVSLFYLASGFIELCMLITGGESVPLEEHFLINLYRSYLFYLSRITMVTGGLLLLRLNFARVAAIAIAWWNIFTGPLIYISLQIYYAKRSEVSIADVLQPWWGLPVTVAAIIALILIRLLIIYLLKRSKPGCISIIQSLKK